MALKIRSQLLSVPNVAPVERFSNREVNSRWGHIVLTGVEQNPTLYRRDILCGRWFTPGEKNVALINEQLQQKTGLRIGDAIEVSTGVKGQAFQVVGTNRAGLAKRHCSAAPKRRVGRPACAGAVAGLTSTA